MVIDKEQNERRSHMFKKVLIIEDSHILFEMYKSVFSIYPSCQLFRASNGLDAMDQLTLQKDIDLTVAFQPGHGRDGNLRLLHESSFRGLSFTARFTKAEGRVNR